MTSLLVRIKNNILADIHNLLDKKERKNPTTLLSQYLRNCDNEVKKVELLLKRQLELKSKFFKEKEQAHYLASKRLRQADIAKKANEKNLEERALKEAKQYENQALQLEDLYTKTEEDINKLQNQLQDMKMKLQDMKMKRLELMRRENVAHACNRMNKSMNNLSDDNPFFRFKEVEQQIKDLELQVNEDYEKNTFDMRITKLEKELNEEK